jgi:GT2 family glycosyltransferase
MGVSEARADVVVVSYKSREHLRRCVEPLSGSDFIRVIVVDNAPGDRSLDVVSDLPGVVPIEADENRGFAAGCNIGWRAGTAPAVLFLNPDATTSADAVGTLADALATEPAAGAVAPRILTGDGELDFSLRRFPRARSTYAQALFLHRLFPRRAWVDEVDRDVARYGRPGPVEWVSGAAIMVRRSVLEQLGGWDESYFHYGEDMDLGRRVWRLGYEVRYVPEALATHEGGGSAPRSRLLPLLASNRVRYAYKHRGRTGALLERGGVALGSITHMAVGRGGIDARKGHAGALRVAVSPLEPAASQMARLS